MPPRYLRRSSSTRLKPCQERRVDVCDVVPADQCCGVIPCVLCLEWETYDGIRYGSADFAASSWTGTVAGVAFVAYWERNYEFAECEFVVQFDEIEVYRATCYEGASCRNPAGEVVAVANYDEGTLRWRVYEPRELALIDDPDTGCRDFFCDDCRCTAECLCVTITDPYATVFQGEICDIAYNCEPPTWSGSVGSYELSVLLGRDEYGRCIITVTVEGIEQEPVLFPGCADASATITLEDGTTIQFTAKRCGCEQEVCETCCGGVYPQTSLTLTFTLLNTTPRCACLDGFEMTLNYVGVVRNTLGECEAKWQGRAARPCPAGGQFDAIFFCRTSLDNGDSISELQVYTDDGEGTPQEDYIAGSFDYYDSSCDPFMYCIRSNGGFPHANASQDCADASVDETDPQLELCVTV